MAANVVAGIFFFHTSDNQLAKVDSELEQMLSAVTGFSDPFVYNESNLTLNGYY